MPKKLMVLRILCICLTGLFSALAADAQETPKFEVGPVVSYVHVFLSPPIQAQNEFEIGGRFSWNVNRWLGLEVESQASPFRTENLFDAYQGGYLWQTFAGAKVGKRWDRFGLFGKFRPGISSRSAVLSSLTIQPLSIKFKRRTDPAFDLGGVVEFYFSRRILLRYDFGDTIVHYNSTSFSNGGSVGSFPGMTKNNFQFTTSIAFRFH